MSVINKMLQDLDRRNAMAGAEAYGPAQSVKAVDPNPKGGRDWFWRVVAALLLAAVGWVGWVAYQLQPRPLVTERALRAAPRKPAPVLPVQAQAPVAAPVAVPVQEAKPAAPAPEAPEPAEIFKLARAIETPIAERAPEAAKPAPAKAKPAPAKAKARAGKPAPLKTVKPAVAKTKVTKTARERAEAHFRRAALFLNQGRVSEAEAHLSQALKTDPTHASARQAYVALLLEQGRVAQARELLQEGVAANPSHAPFVLALARIHVEQRDYPGALQVMDNAGPVPEADFQGLRAVVLQRMGRHAEAVSAYQQALGSGPQHATTWMGLGISLEALGHRPEAAQAYKRALGAGALAGEVKEYAEARLKALD